MKSIFFFKYKKYSESISSSTSLTCRESILAIKQEDKERIPSNEEVKNNIFVVRKLAIQRPGAVCEPGELQNWKDFYQVFIKDMRGQIFYE